MDFHFEWMQTPNFVRFCSIILPRFVIACIIRSFLLFLRSPLSTNIYAFSMFITSHPLVFLSILVFCQRIEGRESTRRGLPYRVYLLMSTNNNFRFLLSSSSSSSRHQRESSHVSMRPLLCCSMEILLRISRLSTTTNLLDFPVLWTLKWGRCEEIPTLQCLFRLKSGKIEEIWVLGWIWKETQRKLKLLRLWNYPELTEHSSFYLVGYTRSIPVNRFSLSPAICCLPLQDSSARIVSLNFHTKNSSWQSSCWLRPDIILKPI